MPSDGTRALRASARPSTRSMVQNHNNYKAYQAFSDNQNALLSGGSWGFPLSNESFPAGLLSPSATPALMSTVFANGNIHWPMVQQLSFMPPGPGEFVSDCRELPRACEDGGLYTLNSSAAKSSYPSYTTAPASGFSPSLLANETALYGVGSWHLSQQCSSDSPLMAATPMTSGCDSSSSSLACGEAAYEVGSWQLSPPLTAATPVSYVSSAPSRPYQCLSCPKSPTFSNRKDLDRHLLAKAHWSDITRFYRCSCRAQSARKDHHKRHLHSCDGLALNPYACKCGTEHNSRDEHIDHIENCGRRRRRYQNRRQPTVS
ncbi:hypothetical protein FHL15_006260 [Xylaria flabelliformis]|uniref:Uncharacterized protein n=1 Tax=Xylaria flabelliformis TaxID=2512241 RepID=A0A553HY21_9PEZI|nr:hypothetical protein FHL15_006260 [Xylaria flabelliformis]